MFPSSLHGMDDDNIQGVQPFKFGDKVYQLVLAKSHL